MPTVLDADSIGPVDVAVIVFDADEFNADVAPALTELDESGTVHVIDLAFVRKETDDSVSYVEVEDAEVARAFERLNKEHFDLLSDEDLTEIASGLDPGTSALVIVWENSWAGRLASAVRASHGRLIAQERVPRDTVLRAIAALDEE
jgi:hypothetical protein